MRIKLGEAIRNAIPDADASMLNSKAEILAQLVENGQLLGEETPTGVEVEDDDNFRRVANYGIERFISNNNAVTYLAVKAPAEDVSKVLKQHSNVSSYAKNRKPLAISANASLIPCDTKEQAFLIKPVNSDWCTIVTSGVESVWGDAFLEMLLAVEISEALNTKALVSVLMDEETGDAIVYLENGKKVFHVDPTMYDTDFHCPFYVEGVSIPDCLIMVAKNKTVLATSRPADIERADHFTLAPPSDKLLTRGFRDKAHKLMEDIPTPEDEEEMYSGIVEVLMTRVQVYRSEEQRTTSKPTPSKESPQKKAGKKPTINQLSSAVSNRNADAVKQLIADGVDVNRIFLTNTVLTHACNTSHEITKLLLDAGADPNIGNPNFYPLHLACSMQNLESVRMLIEAGADINIQDPKGTTPLIIATKRKSPAVVQYLLGQGADTNLPDNEGRTPLFAAVEIKWEEGIKMLRPVTADEDSSDNAPGYKPEAWLGMAAANGDLEAVKKHLSEGVDCDLAGYQDAMPLHHAAKRGYLTIVELLISHGADLEVLNASGETPLIIAAFEEQTQIVKRLLKAGANVNAMCTADANALHYCASSGNLKLIQLLIDAGIDVNQRRSDYDITPLFLSVQFADRGQRKDTPAVVEMLCKAGADVNIATAEYGQTALHWTRDLPSIKKMLQLGADPNVADVDGKTPLMYAAEASVENVKALLEAGADPDLKDKKGWNALAYARHRELEDVVKLLESISS